VLVFRLHAATGGAHYFLPFFGTLLVGFSATDFFFEESAKSKFPVAFAILDTLLKARPFFSTSKRFFLGSLSSFITSSSFVGQQSQSFLACRSCLHQVSFALETSSLQSSCKRLYSQALNNRIHMIYTLFLTFRMRVLFMPLFGCLYAFFDGLGSSFFG